MVIVGGSLRDSRRGESSGFSKRNERPNGEMAIYIASFGLSIRDGYRLNPATSRIRRDSEYTFQYCSYYMTTNFMYQIWSDTNLVGRARNWVNMEYQQETKTWLP